VIQKRLARGHFTSQGKEMRGLSHVHEKCPDGFADCSVNAAVMIGHADYSMLMPTGALCLLLMTFFDPARVVSAHLFVLMVVMVVVATSSSL
jgi:hypothetical protein